MWWCELNCFICFIMNEILCVTLTADVTERNTQILIEMNDCYITDLTWKTAMSSRKGLSEMRTISAAGTRYLMFKVRWSRIIMELVETTNRTGTNWMVGRRISYLKILVRLQKVELKLTLPEDRVILLTISAKTMYWSEVSLTSLRHWLFWRSRT